MKPQPQDKLPWELIWQHDGHLTDVVLTALADGQESLVPFTAHEHLGECEPCARRLGEASLLSLQVGEQLQRAAEQRAALAPRFPWLAVAAALLVAALGALPSLAVAPTWLSSFASSLLHAVPMLARSAALLLRLVPDHLQAPWLATCLAAGLVLLTTGFGIARAVTRAQSTQGGA